MFSNGQNVQAADLNDFSVNTVTTTGTIAAGTSIVSGTTITSGTALVSGTTLTAGTSLAVTTTATVSGLVDISGAGAGQIKFPASQNASANANTLDDYEEGTWTPVIGGEGGTTGQTYGTQTGLYTKIGRQVTVNFQATLTVLGTLTGNIIISGLPFAVNGTLPVGSFIWFNTTTSLSNIQGLSLTGTTTVRLYATGAAATSLAVLAQADLANNTSLYGQFTYQV